MPKPDHSQPEPHGVRHGIWVSFQNSTPREISEPPTRGHQAAMLITALASLITALTGLAALLLRT
ncbi:hypothetical protein [Streptomyces sp. NPDC056291]|uniref:hypothetical protein n=1 Tax=Streptomyces sp. NPDC056291 TaxID=3345772 RepID=UPI0035DCC31F